MLLVGAAALVGADLDYEPRADVRIAGGVITDVGDLRPGPGEHAVKCEGMLLVPGLVNAHTHIGDSIAKDAVSGGTDARVHPVFGAKRRILQSTSRGHLVGMMRATCRHMASCGTTTFADFREGGLEGVSMIREALEGGPVRGVVLGRIEHYGDPASDDPLPGERRAELARLLEACDGLGISGANENGSPVLAEYAKNAKLTGIHAAETAQSTAASLAATGRSEVSRALEARPDFLVHMTHASAEDLAKAASAARGVVACPRSNAALGGTMPDIAAMADAGCRVALGTDNVMVNPPDMFREMDFAWKSNGCRVPAREILRMATVNGAAVLGLQAGQISPGMSADIILLDRRALELAPVHDPHAAVVQRASSMSVRAVLCRGEVSHGSL